MTEKCFDIGTIQAFLDGELAPELSQKLTRHIALCDNCAVALGEAEDETAFAFAALEREYDTLVPTHRLWAKINDSIIVEKKQSSVWQRLLASVSVLISNPSMAVAAGVLVVCGIFAVVLSLQTGTSQTELAVIVNQPAATNTLLVNPTNSIDKTAPSSAPGIVTAAANKDENINQNTKSARVYTAAKREAPRQNDLKKSVVTANYVENKEPNITDQNPVAEAPRLLPGEESYVKTIATLTQTVNSQKDEVLRPSAQIAFARDLAVVDDAIKKMKKEVRKNPKNESAKQVLYSSYQNKIDLLNSVTEKSELMASLK